MRNGEIKREESLLPRAFAHRGASFTQSSRHAPREGPTASKLAEPATWPPREAREPLTAQRMEPARSHVGAWCGHVTRPVLSPGVGRERGDWSAWRLVTSLLAPAGPVARFEAVRGGAGSD